MNVTSINRASDAMPANQSNQDSHEISLQKQIMNLQGEMRDITYKNDMSDDEKNNEKKALQEKIKNLNNELKQYQIRKRQKEAAQKETEKKQTEESKSTNGNTSANSSDMTTNNTAAKNEDSDQDKQTDKSESGVSDSQSGAMVSTANTKEHLANMQKIRTNLEGQLRTAKTDEEKSKLQKKLNSVSKSMGEKIRKISDTIADTQKEDEARKEKVKKILKNFRDRMKNMNVSVPKSSKTTLAYDGDWDDNSAMPGKVLLTRKKS